MFSGMKRTTAVPSAGNVVDNDIILPFRADNCGCRLFHNGLSLMSTSLFVDV